MYGAILGDIIGSPYEWNNIKTKDFELFSEYPHFSDDTVLTLAVAKGFMQAMINDSESFNDLTDENIGKISKVIAGYMKLFGKRYPNAGYGGKFIRWIKYQNKPYNSWGNGSAMRVSSAAWFFDDIDMVRKMAELQAAVTHNHPDGIRGAEAIASAIFIARKGGSKEEIRDYVEKEFGYDLSRTCDEIRPTYTFDVSCNGSVPEAIIAFLEGEDFEDVIRTAISLGGDSDTIGAMAGSIAEAFYGVPDELKLKCKLVLTPDLREVLEQAEEKISGQNR